MSKIFGKNIVNVIGNKKKSSFWPHLLLGMLALFLLPANQEFEVVNDNLETNYQPLQQVEQSHVDIAFAQQFSLVADWDVLRDFPKLSQNLPHFYAKILVRQRPIRAGPVI